MMTVNELIERLKETGDDKFRDAAKVAIVKNLDGLLLSDDIDPFNIKVGVNVVNIGIDPDYASSWVS